METSNSDKKTILISFSIFGVLIIICLFFIFLYVGIRSLNEPRYISYTSVLPGSASDVHEHTDYLQPPPDEEYRYYLKAKVTEDEFQEIAKELKLDWASQYAGNAPTRKVNLSWWDPPSGVFLYGSGNGADYVIQADYISTGYMYLYVVQN